MLQLACEFNFVVYHIKELYVAREGHRRYTTPGQLRKYTPLVHVKFWRYQILSICRVTMAILSTQTCKPDWFTENGDSKT